MRLFHLLDSRTNFLCVLFTQPIFILFHPELYMTIILEVIVDTNVGRKWQTYTPSEDDEPQNEEMNEISII